ncbi:Serine/threonine-protein phosphatase 2A regulatory subunit B'' subunit beta [Clydaea vesicula]|uniref:Serine/threonine-protein phosphatase 2A regulatory subunit B'' subunit beta n=1 Tax=Clydaea vesicula TaxID=447962 RepID=A0AAD5U7T0_9FUNG|nr:Serine/threonine-protein phosphatase 2A regulatory subunit B'' subunit beta [Clydaea vesicula]
MLLPVETVILRTFFEKKNSQNKRMTLLEFKKSSFLPSIELLSNLKEDINLTRSIFSYKHYYVMYCRFWDLDLNHDMKINFQDFQYFNNSSLTRVMCNKIVKNFRSERGFRNRKVAFQDKSKIEAEVDDEFLTFGEFCFFLLCNEDKKKDTSIEFWFRCLDTDADGILSLYELKNFWEEQYERMLCINFPDPWLFDDFICVLIDLIKPNDPFKITILDLKKCKKNTELFLDMIFDIRKYEHHIKRNHPEFRDQDDIYICNSGSNIKIALDGWDKYAEKSYDEMMRVESRRRQTSNNSFSSNNSYNSSQEQNDYNLDNMEWSSNLYNGGWDDNEDHQHNSNEVVQDFTSTQA